LGGARVPQFICCVTTAIKRSALLSWPTHDPIVSQKFLANWTILVPLLTLPFNETEWNANQLIFFSECFSDAPKATKASVARTKTFTTWEVSGRDNFIHFALLTNFDFWQNGRDNFAPSLTLSRSLRCSSYFSHWTEQKTKQNKWRNLHKLWRKNQRAMEQQLQQQLKNFISNSNVKAEDQKLKQNISADGTGNRVRWRGARNQIPQLNLTKFSLSIQMKFKSFFQDNFISSFEFVPMNELQLTHPVPRHIRNEFFF
jgi:hypothetical protein